MARNFVKFETYNAPHAPREQPEDVVFIAPDHVVAVEQDTVLSYVGHQRRQGSEQDTPYRG